MPDQKLNALYKGGIIYGTVCPPSAPVLTHLGTVLEPDPGFLAGTASACMGNLDDAVLNQRRMPWIKVTSSAALYAHHPELSLTHLGINTDSCTCIVKSEPISRIAVPVPAYFWS